MGFPRREYVFSVFKASPSLNYGYGSTERPGTGSTEIPGASERRRHVARGEAKRSPWTRIVELTRPLGAAWLLPKVRR